MPAYRLVSNRCPHILPGVELRRYAAGVPYRRNLPEPQHLVAVAQDEAVLDATS